MVGNKREMCVWVLRESLNEKNDSYLRLAVKKTCQESKSKWVNEIKIEENEEEEKINNFVREQSAQFDFILRSCLE